MIALRREAIAGALFSERVLELPKYARTKAATYWHIPRSAERRDGDRLSVRAWCGVTFHGQKPILLTDVEPPENVCGTCAGRYEGAMQDGVLIFSPRDDFAPPRWCPGNPDETGHCVACGERVRAYGWWGGAGRHRPGPAFAERCHPCPDHGFKVLAERAGRVVCRVFVGSGWDHCDFDCGPRRAG